MDAGAVGERWSRRERIAFLAIAIAIAVSRWPALSQTLWDWDEALFALAMADYDVAAYHPQPPGFPLFIGLARLVPGDAFHALQTVTFVASLFVFPAMVLLARELRATPGVAMAAGALLAFFPNVWFYGGTALSDVPSMVLVVAASGLLLRGRRDRLALVAGAILLGVAAGFRPQNLLIGAVPLVVLFLHRRRGALLAGAIVAAIVIGAYGAAAWLSGGWDVYRDVLARHEAYIRSTDSFLAPRHPGLLQVADDFFFRPYRAPLLNVAVTLFAAIALVRRRPWLALAMFGPFCLFAWLFLDFHSASRFSVAYMPLFALLAAEGIPRRGYAVVATALVVVMIVWTWPALRVVHTSPSPPVAALQSLDTTKTIYVDERLGPHAALLLRRYEVVPVAPPFVADGDAVLIREGATTAPGSHTFARDDERLANLARRRYFEVSVIPGVRPHTSDERGTP
jgi:hypothetical protein